MKFFLDLVDRSDHDLSINERNKLDRTLGNLKKHKDIGEKGVLFLETIINQIKVKNPELLRERSDVNEELLHAFNCIVRQYNDARNNRGSIESEFQKTYALAHAKSVKYASVFNTLGVKLNTGEPPSLVDVYHASEYYNSKRINSVKS